MALSALDDPARAPDEDDLAGVLGAALAPWRSLRARVESAWPPVEAAWSFGGAKHGWSLRLIRRKRVVVYLIPGRGGFLAGVVLGDRAVAAARAAGLPAAVAALLDAAPRYGEGTGLRVPVRRAADLAGVWRLLEAKMAP